MQVRGLKTEVATAKDVAENIRMEWQLDSNQRESQLKESEAKRQAGVKEIKAAAKEAASLQKQLSALSAAKMELESQVNKLKKQVGAPSFST